MSFWHKVFGRWNTKASLAERVTAREPASTAEVGRCHECGGPLETGSQRGQVYRLPFQMAFGNTSMLPVCRQCYLEAEQRKNPTMATTNAAPSDAVLAFFLFNSDNPPAEARGGYGAVAETALLRHLFEVWNQAAARPIAETELKACHGDLFEKHILGESACTLRILGRMIGEGDADTSLVPSDFRAALQGGRGVGFIPWAVGLSPMPPAVVRRVHEGLSGKVPGFFVGTVQFAASRPFESTAARLQLPRTLRIRQSKCVGDWQGSPPPAEALDSWSRSGTTSAKDTEAAVSMNPTAAIPAATELVLQKLFQCNTGTEIKSYLATVKDAELTSALDRLDMQHIPMNSFFTRYFRHPQGTDSRLITLALALGYLSKDKRAKPAEAWRLSCNRRWRRSYSVGRLWIRLRCLRTNGRSRQQERSSCWMRQRCWWKMALTDTVGHSRSWMEWRQIGQQTTCCYSGVLLRPTTSGATIKVTMPRTRPRDNE